VRLVTYVVINKSGSRGGVGHCLKEGDEGLKVEKMGGHTLLRWSTETICIQDRSRS
jgi:hypothetical protein